MPRCVLVAAFLPLLATLAAGPARAGDPAPPPAAPPYEGAFLPKAELRVPEFLAAHPAYDGRGVVVAVLDTGVDPGHPRLSTTSTGEPKIVDLLDATDDGIVDTSLAVDAKDGRATGATGRLLTLGAHLAPGKRAGLGRIDARDVLPPELVSRVAGKRRERHAESVRRARETAAPAATPRAGESTAEFEARKAAEASARESLPDETPAFDVLAVETEAGWRVVIDTDADGDLAEERALSDYATSHDWVRLGDDCELNVGVRPDADGRRVRLLFDGNGHGTHVAGIIAGYDGPAAALNGLAPGARVLGIKVGNSRWGGPTTNLAILRALEWAGQRGAKVVNLSFGGPSFVGDAGSPDARAADEAVERHGLLCCFSAGNEGPALSTVGSPATAHRAISVGAYISPATMKVSYGQLGPDPGERLFGFSSRGPLPGGDCGVCVVAPGAAWSTLPSWHLVKGENWHGTSMAAPQVAGAAALLLSGALAEKVPAPPARAIRAIRASARAVPGLLPVEQGAGLVQVDRAFEALVRMKDAPEERELRARVANATGVGGGVYERAVHGKEPFDREVRVAVVWPRDARNESRADFEERLVLESSAPWVEVPPRVGLNASGGSFPVRVDPAALPEGLHCAVVRAFDPARRDDGPALVVPVTVVRPAVPDEAGRWQGSATVAPGERVSRFLSVPFGASSLRLRGRQRDGTRNQWSLALASLDQWRPQEARVSEDRFDLDAGAEREVERDVQAGTVVEVVLFSHWSTNGPATVDLDARFSGPVSPDSSLFAGPGEDVVLLRLATPLAAFRGKVQAEIEARIERPEVAKEVRPDSDAPLLGGDRIHVSVQRFRLRMAKGEHATVVPLGTNALDEQREDARWRATDAAGRVLAKQVIDGPFGVDAPAAGEVTIEYDTPTWGRAGAEAGHTGFEVHRTMPHAWGSVHATADLALEGASADDRLDLPRGSARSVAIRLPALEAGTLYAGVVRVLDEGGAVRLTLPLRVDRRTDARGDLADAEARLVDALRRAAEEVATRPFPRPLDVEAALEKARRARTLRAGDRDLELLEARLVTALAGDAKAAADALAKVEPLLPRYDRADAADRARLGRAHLLRSTLHRLAGDRAKADADLGEARFLLPADDAALLAERVARGGKPEDAKDAYAAAEALAERDPTDFAVAERLVDLALARGWGVPAAQRVRTWPDRFPARGAEHRAACGRVRAAGGDPAPRTLAAIDAGAP